MELLVSEEINHVVKVAGSGAFSESADLFRENFFVAITAGHDPALRRVRIWM